MEDGIGSSELVAEEEAIAVVFVAAAAAGVYECVESDDGGCWRVTPSDRVDLPHGGEVRPESRSTERALSIG